MIDLVVIGAILHFCILGYKLAQAYERYVEAIEEFVYNNDGDDDDSHLGFL